MEKSRAHPMPVSNLLSVFFALVVLTVLTIVLAEVSLGSWEIWVSMGIASLKATLVAAYFMHLRFDNSFYAVILVSSLVFVGLFLALTLID